ncbi:fatty acid--CoA ligase family protein [Roseovarius sp. LXJ103]|uniref:ANL family adenylate-forming protein n=1 Tax=Roseovarius carneus TaxID=2853164 RepID=UPI000D61161E|nr:fatty acid--CoA ligase family protein [Roseovarius carneus]MBZ8117443.1 fatty acid--CoA ligase family protein [Roseovarius carneus]PWE36751.1 AMP-dependent synthetase [Pelagicola sp. LXJ1103]
MSRTPRFAWHTCAQVRGGDATALRAAIESGRSFSAGPEGVRPADLPDGVFEVLSGGTTGAPKRIWRRAGSWMLSFALNAARFGIGPGTRVSVLGDMRHSLGLYAVVEGAHLGAHVSFLGGKGPRAQAAALMGEEVLYASPSQLRPVLAAGGALGLRHVIVGGGALDAALRTALLQGFPGAEVTAFYGASETSFITMSDADTPEGSVGRAYGAAALRVDDTGEVWVRGPYVAESYADGPLRREKDWVSAGEIGRLDADGYLSLEGRRDRALRVAERWVHPEAVEAVLAAQPGVIHAAVLPVADAARGQALVAVIEGNAEPEALLAACRGALDAMTVPRRVFRHPQMPITAAGKPDLAALTLWLGRQ